MLNTNRRILNSFFVISVFEFRKYFYEIFFFTSSSTSVDYAGMEWKQKKKKKQQQIGKTSSVSSYLAIVK